MLCNLDRDLRLGHLARPLAGVAKLDDPHARRMALGRAGLADVDARDSFDAGRLAAARRRAFTLPARVPVRRPAVGHLLDRAADTAAFGLLVAGWVAGYCLLCSPARAATAGPLLTDERLFTGLSLAPVAIVVLLILAWSWRDPGRPYDDEASCGDELWAPATAPDHATLEQRLRDADRG